MQTHSNIPSSCSLVCSKAHKAACGGISKDIPGGSENEAQDNIKEENSGPFQPLDAASSSMNHFSELEISSELKHLFTRYPALRSQLQTIYKYTKPPEPSSEEQARSHGDFSGHARSRNGHNWSDRGAWTEEKGFDRGLSLLKKLRNGGKENSEGLKEFSELVHLVRQREEIAHGQT
jgi:hypothetical protein